MFAHNTKKADIIIMRFSSAWRISVSGALTISGPCFLELALCRGARRDVNLSFRPKKNNNELLWADDLDAKFLRRRLAHPPSPHRHFLRPSGLLINIYSPYAFLAILILGSRDCQLLSMSKELSLE